MPKVVRNDYNMQSFYNQIMKNRPLLYGYQFVVEFMQNGTMNGELFTLFNNDENDPAQNFTYYAQSAKLPAFELGKSSVSYYGNDFRVPTVIKYEHDWDVTLLLEQDMIMHDKMHIWMNLISNLRNNGGGIKTIPNVNLRVNLLDSTHTYFTTSYVLVGVWPTNLSEVGLKYNKDDNTPLTITAKFKYQYCYRDDEFTSDADPLSTRNHKIQ